MKIRIVDSVERFDKDLNKRIDKIDIIENGIVMTPKIFSKVFSPERIKLLQHLYMNNVKNIYQLAKELDKPYEVVFRNIKYLEGIGIIKIKDKDNKKIPYIDSKLSVNMLAEA